jgi:hypothetical protein
VATDKRCKLFDPLSSILSSYSNGTGAIHTFFVGQSNVITDFLGRRHEVKFSSSPYVQQPRERRRRLAALSYTVKDLSIVPDNNKSAPARPFVETRSRGSKNDVNIITTSSKADDTETSFSSTSRCLKTYTDSKAAIVACYNLDTTTNTLEFHSHSDYKLNDDQPLLSLSGGFQWPILHVSDGGADESSTPLKQLYLHSEFKVAGNMICNESADLSWGRGTFGLKAHEDKSGFSVVVNGSIDGSRPDKPW